MSTGSGLMDGFQLMALSCTGFCTLDYFLFIYFCAVPSDNVNVTFAWYLVRDEADSVL